MTVQEVLTPHKTALYTTRTECRLCGSPNLAAIWSFGPTPLANGYLKPEQVGQSEPMVPLDIYRCEDCQLVQMCDVVAPELLFSHYLYLASTSPTFRGHFAKYAQHLIDRFRLTSNDLVVDVGSNDGILLKPLQEKDIRVLGIDPAQNVAAMATVSGIATLAEFFTPEIAARVRQDYGPARVITANNVFAHTDDVVGFVEAVKQLLSDDGVYVFEVQYLGDLIAKNLFDIVYHEHVCYYHVTPLVRFFKEQGMEIFDVQRQSVHGGSIRVFVQRAQGPLKKTDALTQILAEERATLVDPAIYYEFAHQIERNKQALQTLLADIKSQGKRIVGYGAPAKATTLLSAFSIGTETLEYIVDDDKKIKQGLVMPGSHIPIFSPDKLYDDKPDYSLILAWNFAEPIMKNHARFTEQGGRFIIPIPAPRII